MIKRYVQIYERLFTSNKAVIEDKKKGNKNVSNKKVSQRQLSLYDEAKKRKERAIERLKKEEEELKAAKFSKIHIKDPYICQKFCKEFNATLESINNQNEPLNYEQMSKVCM